jgi:hypothetical protein
MGIITLLRIVAMSLNRTRWGLLAALIFSVSPNSHADNVNYERDVKPVLNARCYACHGALKQEAGLRLDTGVLIRQGGDSGAAISDGQIDDSLLIHRVSAKEPGERMPPEGEPLSAEQIEMLRAWIREGAKSPESEQPEADPREHWAFKIPQRPAIPEMADASVAHPIDAFLNAELARHALTARPSAPKHVLLRRVCIDIIGLPPTRDELHAFLADESPDAYEKVVDRLLNDQRHGERWGRHWMDVWRYSDWYGRRDVDDVRNSASQLYRWRDWIVRSLNQGKGYDQMVREMLAADEICPDDYDAGVATGYLIRNYYSLNANDWMRNAVEHTGKAFLGLTFNCAHCHDHKYDPISHDDYFRMRAFFEPIFIRQDRMPGEADPGIFQDYSYSGTRTVQRLGAVRVFDKTADAPTWFYTGGDERNRVKERGSIPPGVPSFLENAAFHIEPVNLPAKAWYPGLRPELQESLLAEARSALTTAEESLSSFTAQPQAPAQSSGEAVASGSGVNEVNAANDELAKAEAEYEAAFQEAIKAGTSGAISGRQSLLMDATTGRSIVQNNMQQLKSFDDGARLTFRLRILQDSHVNFQFVKDSLQGLTAGYCAFEKGRIVAYVHGVSGETEVGRYDFAAGQNDFEISVVIRLKEDLGQLTVVCCSDSSTLVENASLALNGWNPVGTAIKPISFDVRPGSVAVIDDFAWSVPNPLAAPSDPASIASWTKLIDVDFEAPKYIDGRDVIGIDGWEPSSFRVAPATSLVSASIGNPELRALSVKLEAARRAARRPFLQMHGAEASVTVARADLASLEARIAADRARYSDPPSDQLPALIKTASRLQREAALRKAEAEVLAAEFAVVTAEAKPSEDAERAKAIETATAGFTTSMTNRQKATEALTNEQLSETYSPLSPSYPQQSTGRRRALAEWMTSKDNPLTARVAVNHIWARHFHSPLVASMNDFGRNGDKPTHPELLDWLAVEFMESGWDMKHLHRLIVTSNAYRRDSVSARDSFAAQLEAPAPAVNENERASASGWAVNRKEDPENKLLWRMNSSRMESEVVRDSLLFIAGRLDLTLGGVEIENKDALTTTRRSLYYSVHPEAGGKSSLGELFDAPDPLDCYRRVSSIVPQQALALTNSELVHESSVAIVKAWQESGGGSAEQFISYLFEQILSRQPTQAEIQVCLSALQKHQQLAASPDSPEANTRAHESLARILLNHNDFITVR